MSLIERIRIQSSKVDVRGRDLILIDTIISTELNIMKGELEDICGQLGDIEGEWQKTAEEVIKRIQALIE